MLCALSLALACTSTGTIQGNLTEVPQPSPAATTTAAPAPIHEHVAFVWESSDFALSGTIRTTLPSGESFDGRYHEITSTTTVDRLGGFYGAWYGAPWYGASWGWGGAWPYYGSGGASEFITHYSGDVVAMLDGDRGTQMRCRFSLEDGASGMRGGGVGECQLSSGDRITAIFPPS